MKKIKTHELSKRLLFTLLILLVYMVGRSLLLYNVDPAAYELEELNSENIIVSMVSGDRHRYTLFALGIMPYITSTLIMWIFMAVRGAEFRARSSPRKTQRLTLIVMIVISALFALSRAEELIFKESNLDTGLLKGIAVLEMIIGAVIIHKMAKMNQDHGIGSQMPIILVNILDNLFFTLFRFTWQELSNSLILCLIMAIVILFMESVLIRIPVQRVSIHNTYADKSYIAFKLDPIGVMPVMFAVSFFMLPQLLLRFLMFLYKDNTTLLQISGKLNLTNSIGVVIYLGIIFTLNLIFSFIMLAPKDMAEQLQKGGDSIVGIYAGKKTKKYLRKKLWVLCVISGSILCLLMGISLFLSLREEISSELALLPATAMILTSLMCALYREVKTYWRFDSYSFFI